MNTKAKERAMSKVWRLEGDFFTMNLKGEMSNDEYDWTKDHLMNVISSLQNFDDIDGLYEEEVEA